MAVLYPIITCYTILFVHCLVNNLPRKYILFFRGAANIALDCCTSGFAVA